MKLKILILPVIALISIVGLCILLINCGEPDPCAGYNSEPQYFDIPAEDTLKIPYKGYEALKFQVSIDSQIVDTITLIGTGRNKSYERFTPTNAPYSCVTYLGESHTIEFKNSDSNSKWGNLIYNYYFIGSGVTDLETHFREIIYQGSIFLINNNTWGGFIPNQVFNGKSYYNIAMFTDSEFKRITQLTPNDPKIYHTTKHGIIRMEIDSSEVWDLIN